MTKFDRITSDPGRMNGEPCIRNLRLTVRRVLEALSVYPDREEFKREYPEIEDEDIRQAIGQLPSQQTIGDSNSHRSLRAPELAQLLLLVIERCRPELDNGAAVSVSDAGIRVRMLPLIA